MSRPEKPIDWKKVEELLIAGCLGTEIAGYFDMHHDTFYRRVEEKYKMGFTAFSQQIHSKGESLLRAHQFAKALGLTDKGDNTLLIWLGKTRLKQKESTDEQPPNQTNLDNTHELLNENKKLREKLESLQKDNANQALNELVNQAQELKLGYEC